MNARAPGGRPTLSQPTLSPPTLSPQSHLPIILRYSAYRLAAWVAVMLVSSFVLFMRHEAQVAAGRSGVLSFILMVMAAVGALGFAVKLLASDDTAVAADETHIELVTLWKRQLLRWDELRSVRVMERAIYVFGFIPVGRRRTLRVERDGRWVGKKIDLPLLTVARDDAALQWLLDRHRAGQPGGALRPRDASARARRLSDGAAGDVPASVTPATVRLSQPAAPVVAPVLATTPSDAELAIAQDQSGEFSPDAALERYLARRDTAVKAAPIPASPSPVTHIAPIPRAPVGAMGARSGFGRKSA